MKILVANNNEYDCYKELGEDVFDGMLETMKHVLNCNKELSDDVFNWNA